MNRTLKLVFIFSLFLLYATTDLIANENNLRRNVSIRSEIKTLFQKASDGWEEWNASRDTLYEMPTDHVMPVIIDMLHNDVLLIQNSSIRTLAYGVLVRKQVEQHEAGYNQLIAGLSDAHDLIRKLCLEGLGDAPLERRGEILEIYQVQLNDNEIPYEWKEMIVRILGKWGASAKKLIPIIENYCLDQNTSRNFRSQSCLSTFQIGGLEYTLDKLQKINPEDEKFLMQLLTGFVAQNTSYGKELSVEDAKHLPEARELVLETLKSEDVEVRKAAYQAILPVFGFDVYIIRSRDDYELNPDYKAALEHMADHDPDSELREAAANALDPKIIDRRVAKYFRVQRRKQKALEKKSINNQQPTQNVNQP